MRFKVVPFQDGDRRDDAVLRGIANGFSDLFPVPDHPVRVLQTLAPNDTDSADRVSAGVPTEAMFNQTVIE